MASAPLSAPVAPAAATLAPIRPAFLSAMGTPAERAAAAAASPIAP